MTWLSRLHNTMKYHIVAKMKQHKDPYTSPNMNERMNGFEAGGELFKKDVSFIGNKMNRSVLLNYNEI